METTTTTTQQRAEVECRLKVGDVIFRPWSHSAQTALTDGFVHDLELANSGGGYIFKARQASHHSDFSQTLLADGDDGWLLLPGQSTGGLVVFCSDLPSRDFTHVEVVGVSRSGNAVFVNPVCGDMDMLRSLFTPVHVVEMRERHRVIKEKREEYKRLPRMSLETASHKLGCVDGRIYWQPAKALYTAGLLAHKGDVWVVEDRYGAGCFITYTDPMTLPSSELRLAFAFKSTKVKPT